MRFRMLGFLTGVPYRINIGKKLTEGKVEIVDRITNLNQEVALGEVVQQLRIALNMTQQ